MKLIKENRFYIVILDKNIEIEKPQKNKQKFWNVTVCRGVLFLTILCHIMGENRNVNPCQERSFLTKNLPHPAYTEWCRR